MKALRLCAREGILRVGTHSGDSRSEEAQHDGVYRIRCA